MFGRYIHTVAARSGVVRRSGTRGPVHLPSEVEGEVPGPMRLVTGLRQRPASPRW